MNLKLTTKTILFAIPALLFTGMVLLQSCYYHKPEIVAPVSTCDTSNVKYSGAVVNIMRANCYSCHTAAFPSGGFALDSYAGVKGAVSAGLIPDVFFRTGSARMPQNLPPLSACEIAIIRSWIRNGALNN